MSNAAMRPGDRMRATYELQPVDHLHRTEFGWFPQTMERWQSEGLPEDWQQTNLFNFDPWPWAGSGIDLGWCEAPFIPKFEEKVVESTGDYEIIQDSAGRWLKVFTGQRIGFMPDYLRHPVTDMDSWREVATRLDPANAARWDGLEDRARKNRAEADEIGSLITHRLTGGYMYLRSLIGPEDLLYMFYDQPEVIHAAMQAWFDLMDAATEKVQAVIELDELFMAEDICYNHGLLISPAHVREFLLPYYQRLLHNARNRQKRKLYYQVDTDGDCRPAIPLYMELGLDVMSPMEVASGCDVVEIGRQYPRLVIRGGIDKRVLAAGKDAMDAHLEHIIPEMVRRGGFYPMCDHAVPSEVSLANYLHYRKRVCELDH